MNISLVRVVVVFVIVLNTVSETLKEMRTGGLGKEKASLRG